MSSVNEIKTYFILNDLPNGDWSVSWPGYESNVVNNPDKAMTLLEILFDHVGVETAMIGVLHPDEDKVLYTKHISCMLWLDEHSREHCARDLARYTIPEVRFKDRYEAEKFKLHLEQRLMWKRLGGSWQS